MPWPPPGGQGPQGPPDMPMPDVMSDTQRMLQPQGLFRSQGQYGQGQYGQAQYGQAQYGQGQFDESGQFGPPPTGQFAPPPWPGGPGTDTMPRGGPPIPGGRGPRSRMPRRLVPVILACGLAVVVVVALLLSSHGNSSSTNTTAGTTTSPTATPTVTSDAAFKQAATRLAALLPQSGTDRGDVVNAVTSAQACKTLPKDAQTFNTAAKNRQNLLARLASLPGRSALPPALISSLTSAWQASAEVDTDLGKWATTAIAHCHKGNPKDPNLTASAGPDGQATSGKRAFVKQWNPIAKRYGLPTYTIYQL